MARKRDGRRGLLGVAGPLSWRNWLAKRNGAPAETAVELSLFSDAWFTSEALDLGPYTFLNALPRTTSNLLFEWKPAIVLRAEQCLHVETGDMSVTDDEHYHGGNVYDEVAALVAILLGVRLVAGPIEREFGYSDDILGRPRGHSAAMFPTLPGRVDSPQIESLFCQRSLDDLGFLASYPNLAPDAAFALVKSARLYQQALWVSDTSPETAWLLLISAIETGATFWNGARLSPAEQLDLSYSELANTLRASPDETVFDTVANALRQLTGSTAKFVSFCTTFTPEPPEHRPKSGRFNFDPDSYKTAIKQIYGYRSRALHGGTPFPYPMCIPPKSIHDGTGIPAECLPALGMGSLGATWVTKDVPMYLHLFAHISRGVILNWWRFLANNSAPHDV